MKRVLILLLVALLLLAAYLLAWPVPVDPVAWTPPEDRGYVGPHAENARLAAVERVPVPGLTGPEDLVADPEGTLYTTSHEGWIARRRPGGAFERWIDTGGRPLGLDWDVHGDRLVVADAYRGLLAVDREGRLEVLAAAADGIPIRYADDVAAAADGRLYFSDASTQFGAEAFGGTYAASLLDILEHGGHGRLLVWTATTGEARAVLDGIDFANGVALGPRDESVLLVETGSYRVLRHHVGGPRAGQTEVVLENLPGFPDNLSRGAGGRYWLGLVSSRRAIVDAIAPRPLVRKLVQRLPAFVRPEATRYGHVIAFELSGRILEDLQDPSGAFARTTGALEAESALWVTSLHEPDLARLPLDVPLTSTTSAP